MYIIRYILPYIYIYMHNVYCIRLVFQIPTCLREVHVEKVNALFATH